MPDDPHRQPSTVRGDVRGVAVVTGALPRPARPPGAARGRTVAGLRELLGVADPGGAADGGTALEGATLDSRAVRPRDLYAALPGATVHGARFAADAAAAGAAAVLTDPEGLRLWSGSREQDLPAVVVDDPRGLLGRVSAWVYGDPADELLMLGVTGTNGKTTTCYLLDAALRHVARSSGRVDEPGTGMIGTVETRVGDRRIPSLRTTPESPDLHALLALMRDEGVSACAMEVSSHALALHRVDAVRFDVAGFTNLSQDHLDFHPDLEHYFATKASLFTPDRCGRAVVCVDDAWGARLADEATVPVVTFTTPAADERAAPESDWYVSDLSPSLDGVGMEFTLAPARGGESLELVSPLPGDFNVANTALAALMLLEAGVERSLLRDGLAGGSQVPGRMQVVGARGRGPLAVVDYAHSPDAVAAALGALRRGTTGCLVVVLGAGGDRDTAKREAMGAAAAEGADVVVVTDDNPRSESPALIRAAVVAGARAVAAHRDVEVLEVGDRREAVAVALRYAGRSGDTVLVAGKGHEQGQEVAGTVHPFDDREVLAEALVAAGHEGCAP